MCHDGDGKYLMEHRSENCRDEQNTWSPVGSGGLKVHDSEEAVKRSERGVRASATNIEFLGLEKFFEKLMDGSVTGLLSISKHK